MEAPQNPSEVCSLLGITNYCGSRFTHNYATLTHELRQLTKKNTPWQWSKKHETFQALKEALTEMLALSYFDLTRPTEIHVDGSPVGLCGILMQAGGNRQEYTVKYASPGPSGTEVFSN